MVFVRDFVIIDHPLDYVWARVLGSTESVGSAARAAFEVAARLGASTGLHTAGPPDVAAELDLMLGVPRVRGDGHVVALRLSGPPGSGPVRSLEGDLELVPIGGLSTLVSLDAALELAPGEESQVLARVVSAAVRAFLDGLVRRGDVRAR